MKTPHSFRRLLLGALSLVLCARAAHATCIAAYTMDYDPVCGDNGLPYANKGVLAYESCLHPNEVGPTPVDNFDCLPVVDEGPIGGTAGFDEPDFPGVDPPGTWDDEDDSSNESSSSSGDSDSDDSPFVPPPPGVVIDDSAPPAANFDPTSVSPSPTVGLPAPPAGNDTVVIVIVTDPEGPSGGIDLDDKEFESSEWLDESASSTSSDGLDEDDGSDAYDDGDDGAQCEKLCLSRYEPVCATNGETYGNACELSVAQCKDPSVKFKHGGDCNTATPYPVAEGDDPCAFMCPMWDHPVCSDDGHIYANECVFKSMLCRDPTLQPACDSLCKETV